MNFDARIADGVDIGWKLDVGAEDDLDAVLGNHRSFGGSGNCAITLDGTEMMSGMLATVGLLSF